MTPPPNSPPTPVLEARDVTVRYDGRVAVDHVSLRVPERKVVALIGPSGSGKSTLLRALNRMSELVEAASVAGSVLFRGEDVYAADVDPAEVRRRIGIVFENPVPFSRSVYDNVAFAPRIHGFEGPLERAVEEALRTAGLWDEVRNRLQRSALELSSGQQQRLCIARTLAARPDVILMDEPTAALDPIATQRIEELIYRLKSHCAVVVVTSDPRQAARVSDYTAFLHLGHLVEFGPTDTIFTNPSEERTEAYVTGRFG